jgi:RNA polymerase sigma-70 factor, ECF subfamily
MRLNDSFNCKRQIIPIFNKRWGLFDAYVINKDIDKKLTKCILSLPIKYREVLILFHFEELKITEISNLLNLKPNTTKTRLKRGRILLRDIYLKEEE